MRPAAFQRLVGKCSNISQRSPSKADEQTQVKQAWQKSYYDRSAKWRELELGQTVWVRGQVGQNNWLPGIITKRISAVSYDVKLGGNMVHRHVDHCAREPAMKKQKCPWMIVFFQGIKIGKGDSSADDLSDGTQLRKKDDEISGGYDSSDEVEHKKVLDDHQATSQAKDEQQVPKQGSTTDSRRYPSRKHRSPLRFQDEYGYQ